jgi:WD40 repeat protein
MSKRVPRQKALLRDRLGQVAALAYSPDGQTLLSADDQGQVISWDASSGKQKRVWQLRGGIHDIAYAPDGRHVATANANGTVYILRLTRGADQPR